MDTTSLTFAAPRDQQWVAKKSRATQFGDNKHAPHTKERELKAETMEQFRANVLVDTEVEKVLSTTELGRAFLEDLKNKATRVTEVPDEPTPKS
jgi:hypothetical protein